MEINTQLLQMLEKALDIRMANHRVIASNIANVDSPGFRAKKLDFNASLENAIEYLESTAAQEEMFGNQLPGLGPAYEPVIETSTAPSYGFTGNNVDLESELGALTENQMMFQFTAQLIAAKYRLTLDILESEA